MTPILLAAAQIAGSPPPSAQIVEIFQLDLLGKLLLESCNPGFQIGGREEPVERIGQLCQCACVPCLQFT